MKYFIRIETESENERQENILNLRKVTQKAIFR